MADAFNTPSLPNSHPAQGKCRGAAPVRDDDAPFGLFEVGENGHMVRLWHEQDAQLSSDALDNLRCAQGMLTNECKSLDGIAGKLEYVLAQCVARGDLLDRDGLLMRWRMVEVLALASSVIDLHRARRVGAEGLAMANSAAG